MNMYDNVYIKYTIQYYTLHLNHQYTNHHSARQERTFKMKKSTSEKSEEKKIKVFCCHNLKGGLDYLTFPEFILKCETVLTTVKGVRIYDTSTGVDPKTLSKWSEKIVLTVNAYLSPASQRRVEVRISSVKRGLTWADMRKLLMSCFGQETLNDTDEFGRMMKIAQGENESPNVYYDRLMIVHQEYCIAMDFVHGDGLKHSASVKLAGRENGYPYYFDTPEESQVIKNLYYRGLLKRVRDAWEMTKGDDINTVLYTDLRNINRWCENNYLKKKNKSRRGSSNNQINHLQEYDHDDEEDDTTDVPSSKRSKEEKTSTKLDGLLAVMIQNSADVNRLFTASNENLIKICADNNENLSKICTDNNNNLSKIFAMSENRYNSNPSKPWDNMFAAPQQQRSTAPRKAMGTVQVCWICKKPDHFAPKCLYISPTELFVIVYNQLYKANIHGSRTPGYVPLDFLAACRKWGITPPTEVEQEQVRELYVPLTTKTPRNPVKGPNDKAYCHFCHATGHYTRDCKSQCVYCFQKGHGWKNCTVEKYQVAVNARKLLIAAPNNTTNNGQNQVSMLFQAGLFADEKDSNEEYTF